MWTDGIIKMCLGNLISKETFRKGIKYIVYYENAIFLNSFTSKHKTINHKTGYIYCKCNIIFEVTVKKTVQDRNYFK